MCPLTHAELVGSVENMRNLSVVQRKNDGVTQNHTDQKSKFVIAAVCE